MLTLYVLLKTWLQISANSIVYRQYCIEF